MTVLTFSPANGGFGLQNGDDLNIIIAAVNAQLLAAGNPVPQIRPVQGGYRLIEGEVFNKIGAALKALGLSSPIGSAVQSGHRMFSGQLVIDLGKPAGVVPGSKIGGGGVTPPTIGGYAIGQAGAPGSIYAGKFLAFADDFLEATPQVAGPGVPKGKYFSHRHYSTTNLHGGASSNMSYQYDASPLETGLNDAGRGVAAGFSNMTQGGSVLTLLARPATAAEQKLNGGYANLGAMVSTIGAFVFYPGQGGVVLDSYEKRSSGPPAGWHPSFWQIGAEPVNAGTSTEIDFWEAQSSSGSMLDYADHSASGTSYLDPGTALWNQQAGYADFDGVWHLKSGLVQGDGAVASSGTVLTYLDGVALTNGQSTQLGNKYSKSHYLLLTSHIIDKAGAVQGLSQETYSASAWAAGQASIAIDYTRIWLPVGSPVYKPLAAVGDLQVSYLGNGSIVLPSKAALWGDANCVEYLQAIPDSELDPGCTASTSVSGLPTGVTYNATTRTISVDFSSDTSGNPGYVNLVLHARSGTPGQDSGCYPLRLTIYRGPRVAVSTISATAGKPLSYDLYAACPAGSILPKAITVSGLPTGLSFSAATGLITGTPAASGSSTLTVSLTNAAGQSASASVTLTVAAAPAYASWPDLLANFDASNGPVTDANGNVSSWTNGASGQGDLTNVQKTVKLTKNVQNGLPGVSFSGSDGTVGGAALWASASTALSSYLNGVNVDFTLIIVYNDNGDTASAVPAGWSSYSSGTPYQQAVPLVRNGSASGVRYQAGASGSTADVAAGTISPTGVHIIAWRHKAGVTDVWVDGATTKVASAQAQAPSGTISGALFALGNAKLGSALFSGNPATGYVHHAVAAGSGHSDADVASAMQALASQWAATLNN